MSNFAFFTHIVFGLALCGLAYGLTGLMKRSVRIMDHPNDRSSHEIPVPKSGGISIVTTYLIGMVVIFYFRDRLQIEGIYMIGFVGSALLVAGISFVDDITNKSVLFKFSTHAIAAVVVLLSGIVIDEMAFPGLGYVDLGWWGYPLTLIWVLGLTNAFNFMDGLDGLAGGTAAIASLFFMAISYYQGSSFVYITCYTIMAGSLGFLFWNLPPARIFMGDVGSAFLGFVFATLAIIASRYDASHTSFMVMPLLLFNMIYDVAFTLVRRWLRGEDLTQAHRTHLYQLLNRSGYTHREVSLIHYCMCFLQGLGALWMVQIPGDKRMFVFLPFFVVQAAYTRFVLQRARAAGLLEPAAVHTASP